MITDFSFIAFGNLEGVYLQILAYCYCEEHSDVAISKDFIEAQNGKIWLESGIGEGSKFSFSLPAI